MSMELKFPVIRLEIEGMKHTVMVALSEYSAKMDSDIQCAIDASLTPESIARIIKENASKEIDSVIRDQIRSFFSRGDGADFVRDAVDVTMKERIKYLRELNSK